MNTPAHVVLNLLVVGKGSGQPWKPILLGALLPDLPMVVMYAIERGMLGTPEIVIWQERYFSEGWQLFVDVFNSLPLMLVAYGIARFRSWRFLEFMALSMLLHASADLLVHNDDAHRHFLPMSSWRLESPVSYWDPKHFGHIFAPIELASVLVGSVWLMLRGDGAAVRRLGAGALVVTTLFVVFALLVWGPLA